MRKTCESKVNSEQQECRRPNTRTRRDDDVDDEFDSRSTNAGGSKWRGKGLDPTNVRRNFIRNYLMSIPAFREMRAMPLSGASLLLGLYGSSEAQGSPANALVDIIFNETLDQSQEILEKDLEWMVRAAGDDVSPEYLDMLVRSWWTPLELKLGGNAEHVAASLRAQMITEAMGDQVLSRRHVEELTQHYSNMPLMRLAQALEAYEIGGRQAPRQSEPRGSAAGRRRTSSSDSARAQSDSYRGADKKQSSSTGRAPGPQKLGIRLTRGTSVAATAQARQPGDVGLWRQGVHYQALPENGVPMPVVPDGDCFYRALLAGKIGCAPELVGDADILAVRKMVADHILANRDEVGAFLSASSEADLERRICRDVRTLGKWDSELGDVIPNLIIKTPLWDNVEGGLWIYDPDDAFIPVVAIRIERHGDSYKVEVNGVLADAGNDGDAFFRAALAGRWQANPDLIPLVFIAQLREELFDIAINQLGSRQLLPDSITGGELFDPDLVKNALRPLFDLGTWDERIAPLLPGFLSLLPGWEQTRVDVVRVGTLSASSENPVRVDPMFAQVRTQGPVGICAFRWNFTI